MDPYKILGVSKDASLQEIKSAYRKKAAKYHPDSGGEAWVFQQVQDAYRMITEPQKSKPESPGAKPTGKTNDEPQSEKREQRQRQQPFGKSQKEYSEKHKSNRQRGFGGSPNPTKKPTNTQYRYARKAKKKAKPFYKTVPFAVGSLLAGIALLAIALFSILFFLGKTTGSDVLAAFTGQNNDTSLFAINDQRIEEGQTLKVLLTDQLEQGQSLRLGTHPPNSSLDLKSNSLTWQTGRQHVGKTFPCTVELVKQNRTIETVTFEIHVLESNAPLELVTSSEPLQIQAGEFLQTKLEIRGSGSPSGTMKVELVAPVPGCKIVNSTQLTWAISPDTKTGIQKIPIIISDGKKSTATSFPIEIIDNGIFKNSIGIEFRHFQPGIYDLAPGPYDDDFETKEVTIPPAFAAATHEVTVGQFLDFVNATGYQCTADKKQMVLGWSAKESRFKFESRYFSWRQPGFNQDENHPAVFISIADANAFCEWLSKKEGRNYRLPTENEWEYLCRGDTDTSYSFGDDATKLNNFANFGDKSFKTGLPSSETTGAPLTEIDDSFVFTSPIKSFESNPFGLYDFHGNVWELCLAKVNANKDPSWVKRGGSFMEKPEFNQSSTRRLFNSSGCWTDTGFRVVMANNLISPQSSETPRINVINQQTKQDRPATPPLTDQRKPVTNSRPRPNFQKLKK